MTPCPSIASFRSGGVRVALLTLLCGGPLAQETFLECTRVLHTTIRPNITDGFGQNLAVVPDVNGDGFADILLGWPWPSDVHAPGRLQLIDGRSGVELLLVEGALDDRLGHAVSPAGDLDGDGRGDLLAGAPGAGAARVFSSATGALLRNVTGPLQALGQSVVDLGDIDRDGVPDFAVGQLDLTTIAVPPRGRVKVISGASGRELRSFIGAGASDSFGAELVRVGDVNSDGRDELGVLSAMAADVGRGRGRISVLDPSSGVELFTLTPEPGTLFAHFAFVPSVGPPPGKPGLVIVGPAGSDPSSLVFDHGVIRIVTTDTGQLVGEYAARFGEFYRGVSALGDVDQDGASDFVVSGNGPERSGWLAVLSGRTGAVLRRVKRASAIFRDVAALPDVDGDGLAEYVATDGFRAAPGAEVQERMFVIAGSEPVQSFGLALPGSAGIEPQISPGGCPRLSESMRIETEHVLGGAPGALVLGTARADLPFRGGTLHPRRDFLFVHRAGGAHGVPGVGDASIALDLPDDPALAGLVFFVQAAYLDRGAPQGVSLTRVLRLTLY